MSDTDGLLGTALPPKVEKTDICRLPLVHDKPWHRPRKQYIRTEHLEKAILCAVKKIRTENKIIKFMTIPGPELLDIQFVADICKNKDIKLLYTAFIGDKKKDRHLKNSREALIKGIFENVDSESTCYEHRFESIAHGNLPMIEKQGPYNICYIDACGVLAKPSACLRDTLAKGLESLLSYQCENATNDWTLLLTFSARQDATSSKFNEKLKGIVQNIEDGNQDFKDTVANNKLNLDATEDPVLWIRIQALRVACFLYRIVKTGYQDWKALPETFFYYDPEPYKTNLVSIAMNFIRRPPCANSPLSPNMNNSNSRNKEFTPESYASAEVDMVKKVLDMKNVGEILRGCPTINEKMMKSSKELLKNAGFEVSNYERWAKEQCSTN